MKNTHEKYINGCLDPVFLINDNKIEDTVENFTEPKEYLYLPHFMLQNNPYQYPG